MSAKKIILKTARKRKGTVSRAAIRKAVQNVFGNSKVIKPAQAIKATAVKKIRVSVLQAQ